MVTGSILGQKALARRGDICMADIGQDPGRAAILGMEHEAHAEFVGRAFEANSDHG